MKAEFEVVLEGNVRLPITAKMDSLADLAKFGSKIVTSARNIKRMFPDFAGLPIKSVRVKSSGE
jgi:hypothetical protein